MYMYMYMHMTIGLDSTSPAELPWYLSWWSTCLECRSRVQTHPRQLNFFLLAVYIQSYTCTGIHVAHSLSLEHIGHFSCDTLIDTTPSLSPSLTCTTHT